LQDYRALNSILDIYAGLFTLKVTVKKRRNMAYKLLFEYADFSSRDVDLEVIGKTSRTRLRWVSRLIERHENLEVKSK
jgi:hypothetical protein